MSKDFSKAVVLGQLANASNATLLVELDSSRYIYKPKSGERELWDFPTGTLHLRERAAYVVSEMLGWNLVPLTFLEVGPYGVGSFQEWQDAEVLNVDIFIPTEVPADWLEITSGIDETGNEVILAHSADPQLMLIALFDAVINNADRKAGHILTSVTCHTWAIDHGVTFNVEPKLRTVLWGWLNQEIPRHLLTDIKNLIQQIETSELVELLDSDEIDQLRARIAQLVSAEKFPVPNANWPAVPWPVF